jgi:fructose-bisphosphate aldolase class II
MPDVHEVLKRAQSNGVAVGHFNISDSVQLKAVFSAAQELKVPVLIGVSEGEREFIGVRQFAALVRSLREQFDSPSFLTQTIHIRWRKLKKQRGVVSTSLFSTLPDSRSTTMCAEPRKQWKAVKSIKPDIFVEGEIDYIGTGSAIQGRLARGAASENGRSDFARLLMIVGM